jgi:hypothetical protein
MDDRLARFTTASAILLFGVCGIGTGRALAGSNPQDIGRPECYSADRLPGGDR